MKKPTILKFKLFSGGTISIDRNACMECTTQACVRHCTSSTMDPVLKISDGIPELSQTDVKTESGWCVECLACELDCSLYGRGAIQTTFPEKAGQK